MYVHIDWEVCVFDKEAGVCYDPDSGVWSVVTGRGGTVWGSCQRDQGKQKKN